MFTHESEVRLMEVQSLPVKYKRLEQKHEVVIGLGSSRLVSFVDRLFPEVIELPPLLVSQHVTGKMRGAVLAPETCDL